MFPSNPSFIERFVKAKQEEILREVKGYNEREFLSRDVKLFPGRVKTRVLYVTVGLITLAWLISLFV